MSEAAKPSADALSRVPLFSGLERGELEQIAGQTSLLEFEPGSVVVREGERGPRVVAFFVVAEGRAGVSVGGEDRGTLEPGVYFGEIGLLRDAAPTATDEAVYLALALRNVGSGIAVLHGWRFYPERRTSRYSEHASLDEFHRLTRDLYVAPGDIGFWQARSAIGSRMSSTLRKLQSTHR